MIKTIYITVTGKVQGVFYRKYTKQNAEYNGITGFVRNEPDGSVFIMATGTIDCLNVFINLCRQGPPGSSVKGLETIEQPIQEFGEFAILR